MRTGIRRRIVGLVIVALLIVARGTAAQSTFGSIVGTALDQSSLPVPGATIVLRNTDEKTSQSIVSDTTGGFQFLNLKPGAYDIEASLPGFANVAVHDLRLDARQTLRVNLTLALAGLAEDVKVSADAPTITTDTGTIADTKTFVQVTQLPVNYRGSTTSPLAAIETVVGVQQDNSGNVSIGGGTPSMVQYSVDGVSSVNVRNNGALANLNPSSELIREFRVTAYNNNAEFSQVSDVTIATRSGTSRFQGSLFEYLQNDRLDATTYGFETKAPKNFNTFGGSLGGPLKIAGDRTFFFADAESNRRRTSLAQQLSVPTAAMRAGDVSAFGGAIVDPLTGAPFPNNRIPANRLNATSLALLNGYYPLPNIPGGDTNANLRRLISTPSDTNGYDVRIDHAFGSRHQVFGRWSAKNLESTIANNLLPAEINQETDRNLVLSHNWIVNSSATLINELRFGISRFHLGVDFPLSGASAIQLLGLQGLDISNHPLTNAFPIFDFSDGTGFTPIGRDKAGVTESQTTQIADNLIWVQGRHAYKFGFDFRNLRYFDLESFGEANDFGAFTFSANTFTGNAFGDFLLGLPAKTYVARSGPDIDGRVKQYGFYGQDTWNAGRRLTLNYGLRWQLLPPFIDANGNITIFNPATGGVIVPGGSQPQSVPTPGFLVSINACPGYNPALPCAPIQTSQQYGVGPGLRRTYLGNIQPRFSLAWRVNDDGSTVLRGGVGKYTMTQLGQLAFNLTDIHVSDLRTDINALDASGQPLYAFPAVRGIGSNPIDVAGTGEYYQNVPIDYKDPQAIQWNATVEQLMPHATALRISYIGMHTYAMNVTVDLNQVPASSQAYDASLRPYLNWGRILSSENLGWSTYHAFQVEANQRLHHGLAFQASYTLARNVGNIGGDAPTTFAPEVYYGLGVTDAFNLDRNVGNIVGTRRHRTLITGTYHLPFGRERPFLNQLSAPAQALLGGWEVSTVTLMQSGPYLTPTISPVYDAANVNALDRGTIVRPDLVGDPNVSNPTPDGWWNINAFAPTPADAGRIGNAGVGMLRGPGTFAVAAGFAKMFDMGSRARPPGADGHEPVQPTELRGASNGRQHAGDVRQNDQCADLRECRQSHGAVGVSCELLTSA